MTPERRRPSEMKVDELRASLDKAYETIDAQTHTIVKLTTSLDKSEAIHRGELRGRLLKRIADETILTPEDLITMSCQDMQDILEKVPLIKRGVKPYHSVSDAGGVSLDARPSASIDSAFLFGPDAKYKNR